jgi:hypothetical protein
MSMIVLVVCGVAFIVSRGLIARSKTIPYIFVTPLSLSIAMVVFIIPAFLGPLILGAPAGMIIPALAELVISVPLLAWVIRGQSRSSLIALSVFQAAGIVGNLYTFSLVSHFGLLLMAGWRAAVVASCLYTMSELRNWELASGTREAK